MNWVARTAERILGVAAQPPKSAPAEPPRLKWHDLDAIGAAINQQLTGEPNRPAAVSAFADVGSVTRCLVLSDDHRLADSLRSSCPALEITALSPSRWMEEAASTVPANTATGVPPSQTEAVYGAAWLEWDGSRPAEIDRLIAMLRRSLNQNGRIWLRLTAGGSQATPLSPSVRVVAERLLQQIPSRWRLKDSVEAAPPSAQHAALVARPLLEAALRTHFRIDMAKPYGGTLLAPLFAQGCIDPAMNDDTEGQLLLAALYRTEIDLIEAGELSCENLIYICSPRPADEDRLAHRFEHHAGPLPDAAHVGMSGPLAPWIAFNLTEALTSARAADYAAPFPPPHLMHNTTGLRENQDFARHGADILNALSAASPSPLNAFGTVLDFGVGVGRVARYFKGFAGRYIGLDIDSDNLGWIAEAMPWVEAVLSKAGAAIPVADESVDAVISISVFTHIDEGATLFYIDELHRLLRPGGLAFLTLHGDRALQRSLADPAVASLMGIAGERLEQAKLTMAQTGFDFIEQYTHLTQDHYRYGTTFVSQQRAEELFGRRFAVKGFVPGAIHAFQDLIVLERP